MTGPAPADTAWESQQKAELRRAKRQATALLIGAAVVFVVSHTVGSDAGVNGFIRAASEASMVGGIADWFAVTALFRHPLGIPIPHTALISQGKDQIGRTLGQFVQQNFLDPDTLGERLAGAGIATRIGTWLEDPAHVDTVARQAAAVISSLLETLADDDIQEGIETAVAARVRAMPVAPLLGRTIDAVVEGDHHHALVDAGLVGLQRGLDANRAILRKRLGQESPWWVPDAVDDRVFERAYDAIQRFLIELAANPNHELRRDIDGRTRELATRLRTSDEMKRRGEDLKEELLDHPEFQAWSQGLWEKIKAAVLEASERPDSELRQRLADAAASAGATLRADESLRTKVDEWISSAGRQLAQQSQGEISELIAATVERWDPDETSDRLELALGRDLQFVRINGTLVGGMVGVAIHIVSLLLG